MSYITHACICISPSATLRLLISNLFNNNIFCDQDKRAPKHKTFYYKTKNSLRRKIAAAWNREVFSKKFILFFSCNYNLGQCTKSFNEIFSLSIVKHSRDFFLFFIIQQTIDFSFKCKGWFVSDVKMHLFKI